MNTGILLNVIDRLLESEGKLRIQETLEELKNAISDYSNNLQQPQFQINVSEKLNELTGKIDIFESDCDHARLNRLEEIGSAKFFRLEMVQDIQDSISENITTPAVTVEKIEDITQRRNDHIRILQAASDSLKRLGMQSAELAPGTAEIGFLIPRILFENELNGLISELRELKFVVSAFSELVENAGEPIYINQISTTDPLFIFGLSVETIVAIGTAVTWALHTWKTVEEIRSLRNQASASKSFTAEEIEEFFGGKIKSAVEEAIEQKTTELIGSETQPGRTEEQREHVRKALNSIFARTERGMIVEIRYLPPPTSEKDSEAEDETESLRSAEFEILQELTPQLQFPAPEKTPILRLTRHGNDNRPNDSPDAGNE